MAAIDEAAAKTFTILIPSDIHDDIDGVQRMRRQMKNEGVVIDVVLCPGDLTSMPSTLSEPTPLEVS